MREIRPATGPQAACLESAHELLLLAASLLRQADCPKASERLAATIKSVDGARRHMRHRRNRFTEGPPHGA